LTFYIKKDTKKDYVLKSFFENINRLCPYKLDIDDINIVI